MQKEVEVDVRPAKECDIAEPNRIVMYDAYAWGCSGDSDYPVLLKPIPVSHEHDAAGVGLSYCQGEDGVKRNGPMSGISFVGGGAGDDDDDSEWPDASWLSRVFTKKGDDVQIIGFEEGTTRYSTFKLDKETANEDLLYELELLVGVCTQRFERNRIVVKPGDLQVTAIVPGGRRSAYYHLYFMKSGDVDKVYQEEEVDEQETATDDNNNAAKGKDDPSRKKQKK